jgi:hypothetical protein
MSEFYSQVKNPVWANAEHTRIDCEVDFGHLDEDFVPFTADPSDKMEYSKTIFDECVAGQYGTIGEYVAPPTPTPPPAPTKAELLAKIEALTAQVQALP